MTPLPPGGTGGRGHRLFHFRPSRADSAFARISQPSLCPLSCLAKLLLWGVFFVLTLAALFLSNVAAAMVFFLFGILASLAMFFFVDGFNLQGMGRRALRVATVR